MTDKATLEQIFRAMLEAGITPQTDVESLRLRHPDEIKLEDIGVEEVFLDDFSDGLIKEFGVRINQSDVYGWETLLDVLEFLDSVGATLEEDVE